MGGPGRQGVEEMTPVTLTRDKVGSVKKKGVGVRDEEERWVRMELPYNCI